MRQMRRSPEAGTFQQCAGRKSASQTGMVGWPESGGPFLISALPTHVQEIVRLIALDDRRNGESHARPRPPFIRYGVRSAQEAADGVDSNHPSQPGISDKSPLRKTDELKSSVANGDDRSSTRRSTSAKAGTRFRLPEATISPATHQSSATISGFITCLLIGYPLPRN